MEELAVKLRDCLYCDKRRYRNGDFICLRYRTKLNYNAKKILPCNKCLENNKNEEVKL